MRDETTSTTPFIEMVQSNLDRYRQNSSIKVPSAGWGYREKSAQVFYPEITWQEALRGIEDFDNLNFFEGIAQLIKDDLDPLEIINWFNNSFETQNYKVVVAPPYSDFEAPARITTIIGEHSISIPNNLTTLFAGFHKDGKAQKVYYEGNENAPDMIACFVDDEPTYSLFLINETLLKQDPIEAIITLAHELGHAIEKRTQKRTLNIEGEVKDVRPWTERMSSLVGLKMASLLYEKFPKRENIIIKAVTQAALYDHVVLGK